jgi:hypothetical protein
MIPYQSLLKVNRSLLHEKYTFPPAKLVLMKSILSGFVIMSKSIFIESSSLNREMAARAHHSLEKGTEGRNQWRWMVRGQAGDNGGVACFRQYILFIKLGESMLPRVK